MVRGGGGVGGRGVERDHHGGRAGMGQEGHG